MQSNLFSNVHVAKGDLNVLLFPSLPPTCRDYRAVPLHPVIETLLLRYCYYCVWWYGYACVCGGQTLSLLIYLHLPESGVRQVASNSWDSTVCMPHSPGVTGFSRWVLGLELRFSCFQKGSYYLLSHFSSPCKLVYWASCIFKFPQRLSKHLQFSLNTLSPQAFLEKVEIKPSHETLKM